LKVFIQHLAERGRARREKAKIDCCGKRHRGSLKHHWITFQKRSLPVSVRRNGIDGLTAMVFSIPRLGVRFRSRHRRWTFHQETIRALSRQSPAALLQVRRANEPWSYGENLHFSDWFRAHHGWMAEEVQDTRECENCHAEMQPVGKLPAIGCKPLIKVFRCFGCNRIASETQ
jgi:hypothetical protein